MKTAKLSTAILFFLAFAAFGEDDYKQNALEASKKADDGNKTELRPSMMNHINQAQEHLKKADEARQQKNYGKAEDEEQKAMMEQMKAQQLNQQMQANDKSSKDNQATANKLTDDDSAKGKQVKGGTNSIIDLRISETPSKYQGEKPVAQEPTPTSKLTSAEVVDLQGIELPVKGPYSPGEDASASAQAQSGKISQNHVGIQYDEGATGAGKTPSATTTSQPGTASSASYTASSGATGGSMGGGAGATSAPSGANSEFWSGIGEMVDASNEKIAKTEKLSLKNLRGSGKSKDSMPGSELSDEAFWKKVGKEPAQCKKESTERGKNKCLHTARKEMERKWKASKARPVASNP